MGAVEIAVGGLFVKFPPDPSISPYAPRVMRPASAPDTAANPDDPLVPGLGLPESVVYGSAD